MRLRAYLRPSTKSALPALALLAFLGHPFPSSGATLTVCASGCTLTDFQAALEMAQAGDVILLRAGETFVGNFVLPAKPGASTAPIIIRSDAPQSALPPAGTRLVPAGYPGANTARGALARLKGKGGIWKTTAVVEAAPGAHHYVLQFLDLDGIAQEGWDTIVELGTNATQQSTLDAVPYAIVLDRVFVHGHPTKGQKRCVSVNGRDLEVRDSYIAGCGSFALESQAIAGYNGPGPIRIVNNYLEATTENVMFGGADPRIHGLVPSDIEIRRNHFSKPLAWKDPILARPSAPAASVAVNGAGVLQPGPLYFTVVATLESGGDVAQSVQSPETAVAISTPNSAVVLAWSAVPGADRYRIYIGSSPGAQNRYVETPGPDTLFIYRGGGEVGVSPPTRGTRWNVKNLLELKNAQRVVIDGNTFEHLWPGAQNGYAILFTPRNEDGAAPWSVVRDVLFTNNTLRHASGGINILGRDDIHPSQQTARITIRNNLVYDMSYAWGGSAHFLVITGSPADVKVDHNTIFHDGMAVLVDVGASTGFEFTNNAAPHNTYGIFGSGAGTGIGALNAYFPGGILTGNALGGGPASMYPAGNLFPDTQTFRAQFANIAAEDFRLVPGSLFRGAAADGKDIGADHAALKAAQAPAPGDGPGAPVPPPPAPGEPTPYPPAALPLPGTIQAENFDNGGAGVAYADTTSGNYGGQYRDTNVDIEPAADAGGGFNVGWAAAGEWLLYTVDVAQAGTYNLDVRVASNGAGGTFHIEVDGADKTGPLTIPDTGGWQTWITLRRANVSLAAGVQRWRVVLDSDGAWGGVGNFNDIRVTAANKDGGSTPYPGAPVPLPGTVQAEDFDAGAEGVAYHDLSTVNSGGQYRTTGVDIEPASDAGGGYNVGWMVAGEWLNYTVSVASAANYDLEIRVASHGAGGTFHVEVNGVNLTGPLTIPDTGGWQGWTTIRKNGLHLTAGEQVWRVVMDTNGSTGAVGNINFMRVVAAAAAPPPPSGRDIVLYSADVSAMAGNWTRVPSTTGAGGTRMQSSDLGWSSTSEPLAAPADYFEAQFVPEANRAYRVWLRLRASGDSKYNDSVWVQFSGAVDAGGAPLWRRGTAAGLLVNLEACSGCGVGGWGWQNGAWWIGDSAIVRFPTASTQTIRIQTREDGVDVDQIVLSPVTFFDRAPGSAVRDTTIVSKQ